MKLQKYIKKIKPEQVINGLLVLFILYIVYRMTYSTWSFMSIDQIDDKINSKIAALNSNKSDLRVNTIALEDLIEDHSRRQTLKDKHEMIQIVKAIGKTPVDYNLIINNCTALLDYKGCKLVCGETKISDKSKEKVKLIKSKASDCNTLYIAITALEQEIPGLEQTLKETKAANRAAIQTKANERTAMTSMKTTAGRQAIQKQRSDRTRMKAKSGKSARQADRQAAKREATKKSVRQRYMVGRGSGLGPPPVRT